MQWEQPEENSIHRRERKFNLHGLDYEQQLEYDLRRRDSSLVSHSYEWIESNIVQPYSDPHRLITNENTHLIFNEIFITYFDNIHRTIE